MSDVQDQLSAAILENEYIGDDLTPENIENILLKSVNTSPLHIWALIVKTLNLRISNILKTKEIPSAINSGEASVGLSIVHLWQNKTFQNSLYQETIEQKKYQLMVSHEPGPLLADLKGVFTPLLWGSICITALIMVLALTAVIKKAGAAVDIAQIGTTIMGVLCYQGDFAMAPDHGRFVLIVGLLLGYILYTSFSTVLVSQLTIGNYPALPSASTVLSSYRIYALDANILATARAEKGPWAKVQKADDIGLVCQDKVALLVEPRMKKLAPCEVALLRPKYFKSLWGFVMKKGRVTLKIKKLLRRMQEGGLIGKWAQAFENTDFPQNVAGTRAVGIAFISPMIAILLLGYTACFIVVLFEIFIHRKLINRKIYNRRRKIIEYPSNLEENRPKRRDSWMTSVPYLIIVKEAKGKNNHLK